MNEKGWCSTLGGSFVAVRNCVAVPQAENFTSTSPLSHKRQISFPFVFFLAFSLARISATVVSKLFLCLAVKGRPVEWYVYIRACSKDQRCRAKAHLPFSFELCNLANLPDCKCFPRASLLNRDLSHAFVHRDVIFFSLLYCSRLDIMYLSKSNRM